MSRAGDEKMILVARRTEVERKFVPRGASDGTEAIFGTGDPQIGDGDFSEGLVGQAELSRGLRREAKDGFHARVEKTCGGMAGKVDRCAGDGFGSEGAHRVSRDTDVIGVDFFGERGNAFLQFGERVQDEGDVLRTALPERRIL